MKKKVYFCLAILIVIAVFVYAALTSKMSGSSLGDQISSQASDQNPSQMTTRETSDNVSQAADQSKSQNTSQNKPQEAIRTSSPAEADFGTENRINVLFLGIDRTEERDKTIGIYRADTICIARINLDSREAKVLCIPRDTYTFIPDKDKMDKINHSYAYGSVNNKAVEYTVNTVESFIRYSSIDYYFALDMEPVPEIVDRIGGVPLEVEIDMKTHGANLSKGLQVLDGKRAFQYINWRYSGNGDLDRIKRQQKLAGAIIKQLKAAGKMTDFISLVWKYKSNIKTNLTFDQMIAMALLANDMKGDNIEYSLIPGKGEYINKVSYWVPDEKKTNMLLKEFFESDGQNNILFKK
jgi:LCP family protein required for cell wall assembly